MVFPYLLMNEEEYSTATKQIKLFEEWTEAIAKM